MGRLPRRRDGSAVTGRWLVTGAAGMLGRELCLLLRHQGVPVTALARGELDITDRRAVAGRISAHQPAVVVNCAAWTAVDAAEDHEAHALAVNGQAVAGLVSACQRHGARLVQVSTDYVFGGREQSCYQEDDVPAPVNAYGRTKLAGERAALAVPGGYVVRTAWLYGAYGPNFVATMMTRARAGVGAEVVDDQRGQPTWALDVAGQILALIRAAAAPGVYHATSSGATSWYGLARAVFRLAGADPRLVRPVATGARPPLTRRPRCSVLGHEAWARAGIAPIGGWDDRLAQALADGLTAVTSPPQ